MFFLPIPCGKYGLAKTGKDNKYVEGPEYETLALVGSNCELSDIHAVAHVNWVCDELGLDTYYAARGWDENGIPTKDTLEKFNLAPNDLHHPQPV